MMFTKYTWTYNKDIIVYFIIGYIFPKKINYKIIRTNRLIYINKLYLTIMSGHPKTLKFRRKYSSIFTFKINLRR